MKKTFLTLIAVAIAAVSLQARPTGFTIGGGFGFQRFYNIDTEDLNLYGMYVDLAYSKDFNEHHTLYVGGRLGLGFNANVRTGYYDFPGHPHVLATTSLTKVVANIDIPIYYQYNFILSPKCKFFIEVGPTLNFWPIFQGLANISGYDGEIYCSASTRKNLFTEYSEDGWQANCVNVYVGGNLGFKINNHVRIYAGGDYGLVKPFQVDAKNNVFTTRIGAAYIF